MIPIDITVNVSDNKFPLEFIIGYGYGSISLSSANITDPKVCLFVFFLRPNCLSDLDDFWYRDR